MQLLPSLTIARRESYTKPCTLCYLILDGHNDKHYDAKSAFAQGILIQSQSRFNNQTTGNRVKQVIKPCILSQYLAVPSATDLARLVTELLRVINGTTRHCCRPYANQIASPDVLSGVAIAECLFGIAS